jgi:DNA mismatch repair protein MutS2
MATQTVTRRDDPIQTSQNTVDLRGMTGDEAVDAADAFLDRAMNEDQGYAFIIHGHGTGVLKDAIRGYIETSPYMAEWRPGERGEGGDGVTVVWLR